MVGEGHLGGDTGAEAAESGTQNSNTGTEGRASTKVWDSGKIGAGEEQDSCGYKWGGNFFQKIKYE